MRTLNSLIVFSALVVTAFADKLPKDLKKSWVHTDGDTCISADLSDVGDDSGTATLCAENQPGITDGCSDFSVSAVTALADNWFSVESTDGDGGCLYANADEPKGAIVLGETCEASPPGNSVVSVKEGACGALPSVLAGNLLALLAIGFWSVFSSKWM
eukprot:gb/GECG01013090.1/.p1 GENE.gb/GECG01013090.1/~~gb/GECG01013090.1/.p1  ORF type:complete len:158 (+),score=18.66 gb/GECG01013090.1/:1-474(+)